MNLPLHAFRLLLGRRRPITSGTLTAPGIEREVVIRRDGWGVPHISAGGEADAWYGLGFCHGQDRAFQLEASLRVVRGTLAELLGPEALAIDRLSRRVGFVRSSREQLGVLDPGVRAVLEAYAAGVNAGATVGSRKKAHEFALLRSRPSAWTAADVLGYLKLTSFLLSTNWDVELARYQILTRDGPEALTALDPIYRQWQPVISPPGVAAGPALERLTEEIASLAGIAHLGGGSNNWSLAPRRTATGRPILANDPHLAPALPPHWYLTHLGTSDWSVAGASFVGVPGIPVGHNGFAAWGVTVGMTDNTDLFVEEVGPDGRSVRQDGRFVPCDVLAERIGVKGQPDVAEEVLVTPRGPIIGPALDGEPGAISLRAIWLDPLPLKGLVRVHHTRGFADFHRSLADWPFLPLNLAYADESGAIGWQLIGTAPRRRKGNGAVPLPGSDPGAGWEGEPVPYEEMPHLLDPDVGFVVTANNKAARDGTGPFLTVDWIEGYRAARIAERLRERGDWDLPSTARLQLDEESIPWREMRDVVLATPASTPAVRQALDLLGSWDGRVTASSAAASVFELFVAELSGRVARAIAPRSSRWALGQGFHALSPHNTFAVRRVGHLVSLLRDRPAGWFERGWEEEVADALGAAVDRLRATHGYDISGWAWGRVRPLTLVHPFGRRKPFDRIFNLGPISWGGDANTVAQTSVVPLEPTANPPFIASLRMVVDVGNWENSRFVLPGGQSGNPLSPHYSDLLPLWRRGEGIPIAWTEASVAKSARETLRLVPVSSLD